MVELNQYSLYENSIQFHASLDSVVNCLRARLCDVLNGREMFKICEIVVSLVNYPVTYRLESLHW